MSRPFFLVLPISLLAAGCGKSQAHEDEFFVSNFNDPVLELSSPRAGDWLAAGRTAVTGRAEHVTEVTLNGAVVAIDSDHFSVEAELERGINVLELRGSDERGDSRYIREAVIAGEFADPGLQVDDALGIRVNRSGIDFALDAVEDMLVDLDLPSQVVGFPVYEDSYGIFGWSAVEVSAIIGDISFSAIELDGDPKEGRLGLTVTIPDLDIWIPVSGQIVGLDFSTNAYLWAQRAQIDADILLNVTSEGQLAVDLVDPRVELHGFGYDTSLIPGDIETWILVDTVRGFIEDKLVEEVTAQVPALLEDRLAGLDLSFETELLGKQLSLAAVFSSAVVDPKGIGLVTDLDVHIPGEGGRAYAGYLAIPAGIDPMVDRGSDVALSVSDDLFNRLFFEIWRSGILELELTSEDGSLDPTMLAAFGGHEGSIVVSAGLPPVVVESSGALTVQAGELNVRVNTPGGDNGDFLDLTLTLSADADLKVLSGTLSVELNNPEFTVMVRDSDWGAASNEAITVILENSLPIGTLLGAVTDLEIPIPSLAGIEIGEARIDRDDAGFHTGVRVTLQ